MSQSKITLMITLTLIALLLCLVLWITAIIGGMNLTDGCLYRYNFNKDGSVSSSDKLSNTITLKANANYTALMNENGGLSDLDPSSYGQWLNTNLRLSKNQTVKFKMKGELSLCRAYIPNYNLQQNSSLDITNNRIPIPRVEETGTVPATLIFNAKTNEWRNLTQIFQDDKIIVALQKEIKTSSANSNVYNSIQKSNVSADCREGKRDYSPICGRYSPYSTDTTYVDKCLEDKYECNIKYKCYTSGTPRLDFPLYSTQGGCNGGGGLWLKASSDMCIAYKNVLGTAPEAYRNDGKYTLPGSENVTSIKTDYFDRDCKTEQPYVDGTYQNQKYFWFSADTATGLLQRFDSNENPTNKSSRGSNYLFAEIQDAQANKATLDNFATIKADQSTINTSSDTQLIMNKINLDSGVKYLQYRLHNIDGTFVDNNAGGGYVLSIKQTKCRRENGNAINDSFDGRGAVQYIIADYGKNPNTNSAGLSSNNILVDSGGEGSIAASAKEGYLWMRINNDPNDYKDSIGQYQIQFFTSVKKGGFYTDVLEPFFEGFKGKIKGASIQIFKNMTCYKGTGGDGNCTNFFNYIKAILILYIMTYGMMFLMGMVKISQTDLVMRVIKIGIVSGLMNNSTFEFFNDFVFNFTTEFSDTIIANMSGYSLFSGSTTISNPLMFMNEVMTKIFLSSTFAAQIMALPAMGLNGIFYFILIIVCLGIVVIVLFRAIAVYLMAYMAIAVLIGIAPLFLTFILFERTRHLFDNWVRFTFRYMVEPVIMLAGIIILTQLFTIYLDQVIGYSVCWKCAIPIKIPFPSILGISAAFLNVELFCFNWFAPWGFDHRSSQMGLNMQHMVVLLMIAYCLWGYIEYSGKIVGRIAGGVGGPSATGMGQSMSSSFENSALSKVGLDSESRKNIKKGASSRLSSMRKGFKGSAPSMPARHDVSESDDRQPKVGQGAAKPASGNSSPSVKPPVDKPDK